MTFTTGVAVEDEKRRRWRQSKRCSSGFGVVLLVASLAGVPAGALWQPQPAAATGTIRELSWYLDAMHVLDAHEISRGENVLVAVVDTGVDADHPDLRGQVVEGGEMGDEASPAPTGDGREDTDGHGTGMASLIAARGDRGVNSLLGVAPEAKILPVRIAQTSDGSFQPADVYEGVRWAIDHGAKVVNMSLGGERSTDAPWKQELIDYADSKDVVLIAAAGNTGDGDRRVSEPACIPGVVAVSGVTRDGDFWKGSARGPEVVVSAPARKIPMAAPRSVSDSGYVLADGTSAATALVSGVAALIRSAFPDISANDVVNRLINTAEDRGDPGRDEQFGYGVVDARAALEGDVPGAENNPLVSPEPEASGAAAGAGGDSGDTALYVVSGFIGAALVLLVAGYLVSLARRSRQVVVAGVAPGAGPVQLPAGAVWGSSGEPPGRYPGGYPPPGGVPPGSVPPGGVSPGSVLPGVVPYGAVPQGAVPHGMMLPGAMGQPGGFVPGGAAPTGHGPSIQGRAGQGPAGPPGGGVPHRHPTPAYGVPGPSASVSPPMQGSSAGPHGPGQPPATRATQTPGGRSAVPSSGWSTPAWPQPAHPSWPNGPSEVGTSRSEHPAPAGGVPPGGETGPPRGQRSEQSGAATQQLPVVPPGPPRPPSDPWARS